MGFMLTCCCFRFQSFK